MTGLQNSISMDEKLSGAFSNLPEETPKSDKTKAAFTKFIACRNYLTERYEFRKNLISTELEYRMRIAKQKLEDHAGWRFFGDYEWSMVQNDLLINAGLDIADNKLKSIVEGGLATEYDPFREYLRKLPIWTKDVDVDHIKEFLKQIELVDEGYRGYLEECFKKWFVAYVTALTEDRVVNHTCIVLVGDQGVYKSTFFNNLLPAHLSLDYYYNGPFNPAVKDHQLFLGTKMIINLEELATLNRTDVEALKGTITQDRVVLRKAFGRADIKLWRRASFVASINQDEFLTDMSGSRRFLVFKVKGINLNNFNVDLLYSQALGLRAKDFQYWFDRANIEEVNEYNENFRMKSLAEDTILNNYRMPTQEDYDAKMVRFMTTSDIIWDMAAKHNKLNVNDSSMKNWGAALKKLGFIVASKRINGEPRKGYLVVPVNRITGGEPESPF